MERLIQQIETLSKFEVLFICNLIRHKGYTIEPVKESILKFNKQLNNDGLALVCKKVSKSSKDDQYPFEEIKSHYIIADIINVNEVDSWYQDMRYASYKKMEKRRESLDGK